MGFALTPRVVCSALVCAAPLALLAASPRLAAGQAPAQQTSATGKAETALPPQSPETAASSSESTVKSVSQADSLNKTQDNSAEVSTRDNPATFKVRVNLVLVRVVVRDDKGKVVGNLKKEDFQLFDDHKPQAITSFTVETPEARPPSTPGVVQASAPLSGDIPAANQAVLPQRFVGLLFDDLNLSMEDATYVRAAATRLFGALSPSDRAGIYTTSGELTQQFTSDHALLEKALLGIVPRPVVGGGVGHTCPDLSYYEADLIENKNDPQALAVATEDAVQCAFNGDHTQIAGARSIAQSQAIQTLNAGDAGVEYTYRHLEDVMRRLTAMPGQRVLVFISPGFIITTLQLESSDIVDRANRANIVINTIDARGLYTPDMGDIANPAPVPLATGGIESMYRLASQNAQNEILQEFADATGGTFFHNRNDIDVGLRQAAAAPSLSYLLSFSPQNLKVDGKYHTLKVTLTGKQKYSVQARHGYYAPRHVKDPGEQAKQEIQEALFSQEEMRDLPIDVQTQFFKVDATQARVAVLTHVNVTGMRFRKADGRDRDSLTLATAIFDENGNFVVGGEKIIDMRLLETTYQRLLRSGFTVKSSFDVKPGTYLVRQVVRDSEGAQMAARNGAVIVPY